MKNAGRILGLVGLLAIGYWLWTIFFPSPEKVITRNFAKMAQLASTQPDKGVVPRLFATRRLSEYFSTNVEVNIEFPGQTQHRTVTQDEIVQGIMAAHASGGLSVSFPDVMVTVAASGLTAQADVTLKARLGSQSDTVVQAMQFNLEKIEGKWLIIRAQTIRTFSFKRTIVQVASL